MPITPVTTTDCLLAEIRDVLGQVRDRLPEPPPAEPANPKHVKVSEPAEQPSGPTSPRPGRKRATGK